MSEPIKVGDLVVAVRGCGGCGYRSGKVFCVQKIGPPIGLGYICLQCGWTVDTDEPGCFHNDHASLPLSWLKRISPLSELDDVRQDEEIEA